MIVTVDDCEYAVQRSAMDAAVEAKDRQGVAGDELCAIQAQDGDGQFRLTAALSGAAQASIDLAPGALRIRSGSVSRWVPLPNDALPDQAVVRTTDESLTVFMPVRERRTSRHLVYVW